MLFEIIIIMFCDLDQCLTCIDIMQALREFPASEARELGSHLDLPPARLPIFNCAMHPFVKWNVIENCGYFTFIHATIRVNDLPKLEKPWQLEEVPTLQCYCMR